MELYQRLLQLIELLADNSQTRFAKSIGLSQQTFNNYLNPEGQQKIRKTLLDTILAIYPEISRDWLFLAKVRCSAARKRPDRAGRKGLPHRGTGSLTDQGGRTGRRIDAGEPSEPGLAGKVAAPVGRRRGQSALNGKRYRTKLPFRR